MVENVLIFTFVTSEGCTSFRLYNPMNPDEKAEGQRGAGGVKKERSFTLDIFMRVPRHTKKIFFLPTLLTSSPSNSHTLIIFSFFCSFSLLPNQPSLYTLVFCYRTRIFRMHYIRFFAGEKIF